MGKVHILVRIWWYLSYIGENNERNKKKNTVSSWRYQFAPQVVLISSHTIKFQLGWKEMKTCFLL